MKPGPRAGAGTGGLHDTPSSGSRCFGTALTTHQEPQGRPCAASSSTCSLLPAAVEAAARAAHLAPVLESSGDTHDLIEVRAAELMIRTERGEQGPRSEVDWIVSSAQKLAVSDTFVYALTAAAAALAQDAPERSHDLIVELERIPGPARIPTTRGSCQPCSGQRLPSAHRALADRLVDRLEPHYPLNEHALVSARAQLAEHAGDHAEAEILYAEAASRWREFGNVPERAHALMGQGRCLLALGRLGAQRPLGEARDLFASMSYKPALADANALLEQTAAASA
jgi:hypothetical protein